MNAKIFDLERLGTLLKLWDAEIAHLEEQSEAHEMLQAMQEELARLRQLRDEADQELQRMEQAGDPEWRIQGERAERALARLGAAFEQSRTRFGE